MGEFADGVEGLLERGPTRPLLPDPAERRSLREMWGVSLTEAADALGVEPEEMRRWENGEWGPGPEDTRAYYRLLHGFRHRMPDAYEPDWAALRPPARSIVAVDSCDHQQGSCSGCTQLARRSVPAVPSSTALPVTRAPSQGARWNEEDEAQLTKRFHDKTEVAVLAREFGRTENAIRWKLYRLGLDVSPRDGSAPRRPAQGPRTVQHSPRNAEETSAAPPTPPEEAGPPGRPLRIAWWRTSSMRKITRHVTLDGHWTVCKRELPPQAHVGNEDEKWYLRATCYNCAHNLHAHYRSLGYVTPAHGQDFPPRPQHPRGHDV